MISISLEDCNELLIVFIFDVIVYFNCWEDRNCFSPSPKLLDYWVKGHELVIKEGKQGWIEMNQTNYLYWWGKESGWLSRLKVFFSGYCLEWVVQHLQLWLLSSLHHWSLWAYKVFHPEANCFTLSTRIDKVKWTFCRTIIELKSHDI